MGFVVLPALVTDISPVYDAYFKAFKTSAVTRALFPSTAEDDMINTDSEFRKAHTTHVRQYWHESKTQYTVKCVDTETGAIVGMALWDCYFTPSDWKRPELSWLEGEDRVRAETLIEPLWQAREEMWLNQRYLYCHVIAVRPDYQRRGIGEKLFKFGVDVASESQLPIYIESSKEAIRLYEKLGCKRVKHTARNVGQASERGDLDLFVWNAEFGDGNLPNNVKLV